MAFLSPCDGLGAELRLDDLGGLLGEFGGFVLEADLERIGSLHELYLERYGADADWDAARLGYVVAEKAIRLPGTAFDLGRLREAWSAPLRDFYDEVPQ